MKRQFYSIIVSAALATLGTASPAAFGENIAPPPTSMPPQVGAMIQAAVSKSTPRMENGKPDLSGYWRAGGGPAFFGPDGDSGIGDGVVGIEMPARGGSITNWETDLRSMMRKSDNLPPYKPEYWDRVRELDLASIQEDPGFHCLPHGPVRAPAPVKIMQSDNEVVLFYSITFQPNQFRIVPIDGRPHDEENMLLGTYWGDPIGYWDGDTLVVETIGFNDQTWLGPQGWFHGYDLKLTERFTRKGNLLTITKIVEDPEVLTEPWVMDPQNVFLNEDPNALVRESPPCFEEDADAITQNIR